MNINNDDFVGIVNEHHNQTKYNEDITAVMAMVNNTAKNSKSKVVSGATKGQKEMPRRDFLKLLLGGVAIGAVTIKFGPKVFEVMQETLQEEDNYTQNYVKVNAAYNDIAPYLEKEFAKEEKEALLENLRQCGFGNFEITYLAHCNNDDFFLQQIEPNQGSYRQTLDSLANDYDLSSELSNSEQELKKLLIEKLNSLGFSEHATNYREFMEEKVYAAYDALDEYFVEQFKNMEPSAFLNELKSNGFSDFEISYLAYRCGNNSFLHDLEQDKPTYEETINSLNSKEEAEKEKEILRTLYEAGFINHLESYAKDKEMMIGRGM